MQQSAKEIIAKYNIAFGKKGTVDTRYKEVFRLVMPDRDGYDNPDPQDNFRDNRSEIYTSVGVNAGNTFINKTQATLTPINANFIEFQVEDTDPDKDEKNKELDKIASICNTIKNKSNFDQEIGSFYSDLIAGTACILALKGSPKNPSVFRAIPIKDISILDGVGGEVSFVSRKFTLTKEVLKWQWAELNEMEVAKGESDKDVTILEGTYKDYDANVWRYFVIDQEKESILVDREYRVNPFITLRWYNAPGELYGRGVGLQALPDIKTLNKMTMYNLMATGFKLPTLLAERDSILDPDEFLLEPMAINPVENIDGIQPLQMPNTGDSMFIDMERLELNIKKTMLDNPLPDTVRPGITATEIAERTSASNINISSIYGRLENELLIPLAKNLVIHAQEFGMLDPEEDIIGMIEDGLIKVVINTPLMKQQQAGEVKAIIDFASVLNSFDPTGQTSTAAIKVDAAIPYLGDRMGVPAWLISSAQEFMANAQAQGQAQKQAQDQALQDETNATMAVDANKAEVNKDA